MRNKFWGLNFWFILLPLTSVLPQTQFQNGVVLQDSVTKINYHSSPEYDFPVNPQDIIYPPYVKQDFLINTYDGEFGTQQYNPRAASDSLGFTILVWLDYRNGEKEIMAQFYSPDGNRIGTNFKINEDALFYNNIPAPAVNKKGDFVVVWLRDFQTIMGQRFNRYGEKIGANFEIAKDHWCYGPGVSVNSDGSFIVIWASSILISDYTVYAKYVSSSGVPSNEIITVNDLHNNISSLGLWDIISVDSSGRYYVCWSSRAGTDLSKIFLQKLSSSGAKIGENILVSSNEDSVNSYFPEIKSLDDGTSLILWTKHDYNQSIVNCRVLKSDGTFGPELILKDHSSGAEIRSSSVFGDSLFLVMFGGKPQFRKINKNGELTGDTIPVAGEEFLLNWIADKRINKKQNNILLTSAATVRGDRNIYLQEYDSSLTPSANYYKVNDDFQSADQQFPYIKYNKQGYSLVLWEDGRNGRRDLYAQVYDTSFSPVGGNLKINDAEAESYYLSDKCAEALSDGTFIIAFSGRDPAAVHIQAVTPTGIKSGGNIKVGDMRGENMRLKINVNTRDDIQICWYSSYGAWFKRYNKQLLTIAEEKTLMKSDTMWFSPISLSIDTALTMFSCWRYLGYNKYDNKIYGAFYDLNGNLKNSFLIDTSSSDLSIECVHNDSDYVVIYNRGSRYKILRGYLFDGFRMTDSVSTSNNTPLLPRFIKFNNRKLMFTYIGGNSVIGMYLNDQVDTTKIYHLHNNIGNVNSLYDYNYYFYGNQTGFSADLFNDKLFFTYQGINAPGRGIDVIGNIKLVSMIDFSSDEPEEPPLTNIEYTYNLDQNYPNPFNNITVIKYSLHKSGTAKIYVHDILGRRIQVLLDKKQQEGNHQLEFNAGGLSSGVYFYTMILEPDDNSGMFLSTKKMVLIK